MAGYARTNTADIQSGQVVKSAPINAELNAIVTAFAFSGGHNHDGSSTEGGKRQRHKDFTNADYPKNFNEIEKNFENTIRTMTVWGSKEQLEAAVDDVRAAASKAVGMTMTGGMLGELAVELD